MKTMSTGWRARGSYPGLLLAVACLLTACAGAPATTAQQPRNVIILFADGAASTQWELGRYSSHYLRKAPFVTTDVVMRNGTLGLLSTYPADAMVTDSAAAATAMSTGHKTNNEMISVSPAAGRLTTLMESAKAAGKRIGLVTTATVYDASPAAFSVHAKSRREAQSIVDQYLALEPDVLMGGGSDYFLPRTAPGGKRSDGKDIIAAFRAQGYDVARDVSQLHAAGGPRLLGLFADDDMAFEIDRDPAREPSTAEMTSAALRALSQRSPQGFVLFVENENVDSAGHRNDIAALVRDLWAFDGAVKVALDFQRSRPDTLVVVTGDHGTGGLSITSALKDLTSLSPSNRFYATRESLDQVRRIPASLDRAVQALGGRPDAQTLDRVLAQYFPGFRLDADLREAILEQRPLERAFGYTTHSALSRMVSRQTAIYWGTMGHTTEPAVAGALGTGAERLRGYMDNTEFATRLRSLLSPQRETVSPPR